MGSRSVLTGAHSDAVRVASAPPQGGVLGRPWSQINSVCIHHTQNFGLPFQWLNLLSSFRLSSYPLMHRPSSWIPGSRQEDEAEGFCGGEKARAASGSLASRIYRRLEPPLSLTGSWRSRKQSMIYYSRWYITWLRNVNGILGLSRSFSFICWVREWRFTGSSRPSVRVIRKTV